MAASSALADRPAEAVDTLERALQTPTLADLPLLLNAAQEQTHCFPKPTDASRAVVHLGSPAVPEIVARVKLRRTMSWPKQVDNLFLLTQLGPAAKGALPVLDELVDSTATHKYLRHYAETAQAAIQQDVAALARLAAARLDYGQCALYAIETMGTKAQAAAPTIRELARKKPSNKRYQAVLQAIDPALAETR